MKQCKKAFPRLLAAMLLLIFVLSVSENNVSGFGSATPVAGQNLIFAINEKTTANKINVSSPSEKVSLQGLSPFDIEITKDGQYAYLCFDLSEVIMKIRLSDLTVVSAADLSEYFPIECENIALDASEKKLFIYSPTWKKLLVLDTDKMKIIHTIDNYSLTGMIRSHFGSRLITWDGGSTVQIIDTDNYAITKMQVSNLFVQKIVEDEEDQTKWYSVAQKLPGGQGPAMAGLYDTIANAWIDPVEVPLLPNGTSVFDFCVLSGGQKAYIATFDGWSDPFSHGTLYSIDFKAKSIKTLSIDGGALCLAANSAGTQLFVGTGDTNNLIVVDIASDRITKTIPMGRTVYGWPYTQMNRLQNNPADSRFLYATCTDGNALLKIDAGSLTIKSVKIFNNETFHPNYFNRLPSQPSGYVMINKSARSFKLDLDRAEIQKVVTFPGIRPDAYTYDVGVSKTGRLLVAQGEQFLEYDQQNMKLITAHPIPSRTPSIWQFVLSKDRTKIYSIASPSPDKQPNTFIVINTATFKAEKQFVLTGGSFESRPYELPDSSKIYAPGGLPNGHIIIHVISTKDYRIQKTITFDKPDYNGISAGPYCPYSYDPASHTLYMGATNVVLAIDTIKDTIKKVIYLKDINTALGMQPGQLTFINAIGLVYNPEENYLYIAHLDRSFISIYDLANDKFLTRVIPLKGYFPNMLFANDDTTKIFSINSRSDSISVIDIASKEVEKVIDLHSYLSKP